MAIIAPISPARGFNTVFAAYNAALPMRRLARGDEQVERAEAAIYPLFEELVEHPACDLSAIVSKCSAILAQYGEGECPTHLVESIMHDVMAFELEQAAAQ